MGTIKENQIPEVSSNNNNNNEATALPSPIITTPRLILRRMHPSDAPHMQSGAAPFEITEFMTLAFAHPYTLKHAEDWISLNLRENLDNFVICEKDSPGISIGGIGLKPGTDVQTHTAEVGYWVAMSHWGKGYATEAIEGVIEWAFADVRPGKEKQWTKLWGGVFTGNTASMRCLEKCGFRKEGIMKEHIKKHENVWDLHLFGLTKGEWNEWMKNKAIETSVRRWV